MKIPRTLLSKYNLPVPRYTSYPPANYFEDIKDPESPVKMIEESNNHKPENISLYIHIPFCNKICHYCGCNSIKLRNEATIQAYMNAIRQELKIFKTHLSPDRKVSQVHWGGGTPNAIPVSEITRVMDQIQADFTYIDKPEIAIECNPAGLDKSYIKALHSSGFNRVSLGIQDFRKDILDIVNREIPDISIEKIVDWLREKEGLKVNLDFIYGLPEQNPESFNKTIQKAIEINPDRLVTFSYAHVPWAKPAQKKLENYNLPNADEKLLLFENASARLNDAGYKSIGLDHFAKAEDELYIALKNKSLHRNFQGYCTRETTGQVYAAGISSISQLDGGYFQNTKGVSKYIEEISKGKLAVEKYYQVNEDEKLIREVINELMCNLYLNWGSFFSKTGISKNEFYEISDFQESRLQEFAEDGLLMYDEEKIEISEAGKFFIRNIASAFDPKLKDTNKKFSKSI